MKISDTAQIENSLDLVKMMDEERNKTLKSRRRNDFAQKKKKVRRKLNRRRKIQATSIECGGRLLKIWPFELSHDINKTQNSGAYCTNPNVHNFYCYDS